MYEFLLFLGLVMRVYCLVKLVLLVIRRTKQELKEFGIVLLAALIVELFTGYVYPVSPIVYPEFY